MPLTLRAQGFADNCQLHLADRAAGVATASGQVSAGSGPETSGLALDGRPV
jgi:hypothetical protein